MYLCTQPRSLDVRHRQHLMDARICFLSNSSAAQSLTTTTVFSCDKHISFHSIKIIAQKIFSVKSGRVEEYNHFYEKTPLSVIFTMESGVKNLYLEKRNYYLNSRDDKIYDGVKY